jgi:hypothetical protein
VPILLTVPQKCLECLLERSLCTGPAHAPARPAGYANGTASRGAHSLLRGTGPQEAAGLRIKVEKASELVSVAVAEKREAEVARGQLEARITRSREGAALVRRARLQSQLDACRAALSDTRSALQSQVGGPVHRTVPYCSFFVLLCSQPHHPCAICCTAPSRFYSIMP